MLVSALLHERKIAAGEVSSHGSLRRQHCTERIAIASPVAHCREDVTAFTEFVPSFDQYQRWSGRRFRPQLRVRICPSDAAAHKPGDILRSARVPHEIPSIW